MVTIYSPIVLPERGRDIYAMDFLRRVRKTLDNYRQNRIAKRMSVCYNVLIETLLPLRTFAAGGTEKK
jgi:hypothetical protein